MFWEAIVMGLIGESLDDGDNITGARVIDKSNTGNKQVSHRVEIWFRDWENETFKQSILQAVKDLIQECGCVTAEVSLDINDWKKYAYPCYLNKHALNLHLLSVGIRLLAGSREMQCHRRERVHFPATARHAHSHR